MLSSTEMISYLYIKYPTLIRRHVEDNNSLNIYKRNVSVMNIYDFIYLLSVFSIYY